MSKSQVIQINKNKYLGESQLAIIGICLGSYKKYLSIFVAFFNEVKIEDISYIDYGIRENFICFLNKTAYKGKLKKALLSCFDNIKIEAIKQRSHLQQTITAENAFFKSEAIFLLYYPDVEVAKAYKQVTYKEKALLWDFENINLDLKKQIVQTIIYLTENYPVKERTQKFLMLKKVMMYCNLKGIKDIGQFTDVEKRQLELLITNDNSIWSKGDIVDLTLYAVEMSEPVFDFSKNIWYMDAIQLSDIRKNEARPIKSINFMDIIDKRNRDYCKAYFKYLIGITDTALSSIRCDYVYVKELAVYCSNKGLDMVTLSEDAMDEYISELDKQDIEERSFNRKVSALKAFYSYMAYRNNVDKKIFRAFYYKVYYPKHLERLVDDETIEQILKWLPKENYMLSLMYKISLETGLRISEICTLTGAALMQHGWLKVYQPKMQSEKMIPISDYLEDELNEYAEKQGIGNETYLFQNKKGNAYNANTFSAEMVDFCKRHNISCENWIYRSHDYRHHIATALDKAGTPINVIRDFLGHKSIEMTKQYIDDRDNKIKEQQEAFFKEKNTNED